MTAWLISCAVYAAFGYVVVRTHDAERLTPRWLRRFGNWLRALAARVAAAARLRWSRLSFSLHLLHTPKGVSRS